MIEARVPVVRQLKRERIAIGGKPPRTRHQSSETDGEGEGVDAAGFLPAILRADGSGAGNKSQRSRHHIGHIDSI